MNRTTDRGRAQIRTSALLLTILFGICRVASAQSVPPSSAPDPKDSGKKIAVVPTTVTKDEAVVLSPFEVSATSEKGYGAHDSNSVTRFNTELERLPISADILTETFMKDTGVTSVEQLITQYSAGAGYAATAAEATPAGWQPGNRDSGSSIQLRGLARTIQQRDGFMSNMSNAQNYSSNFDVERVEVINGPQALLYGDGGAGGVVNIVSKQARLGRKPFGAVRYQVNKYGGKTGDLDFGFSQGKIALRLSAIKQQIEDRRDDIGGPMYGYYGQVALKLGGTVFRLSGERTSINRYINLIGGYTLTALSTANDARNGLPLTYLLATNQINAAANGAASGAGVIAKGKINWGNVDSLAHWWAYEETQVDYGSLSAETRINHWLSSQVTIGQYNNWGYSRNPNHSVFAPNNTANTLRVWALGLAGGTPATDQVSWTKRKAVRASLLATNDFFGGRAHSQTIVGADRSTSSGTGIVYAYFQADANGNVIVNPATAAVRQGRTIIPSLFWSLEDGMQRYQLWAPAEPVVKVNGVTYVRQVANTPNPALIAPNNPLGVQIGGTVWALNTSWTQGVYSVNQTQWFGGKIDTLAGFRFSQTATDSKSQGAATTATDNGSWRTTAFNSFSYNLGVNYRLTRWLSPYVGVSNSKNPAAIQVNDPYGNSPKSASATGTEVGVKLTNAGGTLSGSVALYTINSKNEQYGVNNTLALAINPTGLNGRFGPAPTATINIDRESKGVQATLTAAPTTNWRVRFSGASTNGTIGSTTSYAQLYNDQFYANVQGQVTYKDGTVVYVPPTFNANQLTVTSTTPGAIPLTIAAMSTPGNAYYANPTAVSGAIGSGSTAARVLNTTDPVHGRILTGVTGLPITAIQINPGFTPPGTIVTSQAGEGTVGYPKYSANLTNSYTFSEGWWKNFQVGGTLAANWYNRSYYYYTNGVSFNGVRKVFQMPTLARIDALLGYSRKLGRYNYSTQLNISNLLNQYRVVLLPNSVNGWAGPNNATFNTQPRTWIWTNTVSF